MSDFKVKWLDNVGVEHISSFPMRYKHYDHATLLKNCFGVYFSKLSK